MTRFSQTREGMVARQVNETMIKATIGWHILLHAAIGLYS
jgi:hypothetical protein